MEYQRPNFQAPAAAASPRESAEQLAAAPRTYSSGEQMRTSAAANYSGSNGGGHMQEFHGQTAADIGTSEDLFIQLRKRLAEADRQARLYADAQQEIDRLRVELGRVRAQAEAEVAQAEKEKAEAIDSLADFKRRIRVVVGND
jgi:hypothetical protein